MNTPSALINPTPQPELGTEVEPEPEIDSDLLPESEVDGQPSLPTETDTEAPENNSEVDPTDVLNSEDSTE